MFQVGKERRLDVSVMPQTGSWLAANRHSLAANKLAAPFEA